MFQGLGDKLQGVFENLRGRGKLTEGDVKAALREVRIALLEADVNLMVAKDFVSRVQEKAIGSEVLMSLRPDERVVSIVHDELVETLGGKAQQPQLKEQNLWMLVGLQGSGKTTTAGKLAYKYKSQGRRPLLVAADTQRPAAREQLAIIAKQVGVPILEVQDNELPQTTTERISAYLKEDYRDLIIVDTAGRLQIDETLMEELDVLHDLLAPDETMLVIDSMTGQQSLDVAGTFDARIGVSGLVMTKLDGDARGGAALSAKQVTGKPIYFGGISEKLDGLEPFYPERVAGRILGMGDVMTLIEKAKAIEATEDEPTRIDEFSLQDMLTQMRKIKQMGSFSDILKMIPGANKMLPPGADVDDKQIARIEAIISSMTEQERRRPRLLNASRRKRIAAGSGTSVQDVNRLMKNYEQMKKMMKKMMRGGKRRGGFPGMPPM